MTTPAAEKLYLAQHQVEMEGRGIAIYNPNNLPIEELPVIYGFNNGGSSGWYYAQAISEDGMGLGSHICSNECFMPHDLGILEGTGLDRHEKDYQRHYPNGYKMEFVPSSKIETHEKLQKAFELNKALVATRNNENQIKENANGKENNLNRSRHPSRDSK